mmetsp:Transcript_46604/g.122363  ORF Transcript_46604/g.122363 Transcript_46604/m.122363 type:complete len:201 (+) Transcript_46604:46-648(+)
MIQTSCYKTPSPHHCPPHNSTIYHTGRDTCSTLQRVRRAALHTLRVYAEGRGWCTAKGAPPRGATCACTGPGGWVATGMATSKRASLRRHQPPQRDLAGRAGRGARRRAHAPDLRPAAVRARARTGAATPCTPPPCRAPVRLPSDARSARERRGAVPQRAWRRETPQAAPHCAPDAPRQRLAASGPRRATAVRRYCRQSC